MSDPAATSRVALLEVLFELDVDGIPVPCRRGDADRWFSTSAEERAAAAGLCAPCPALVECGAAARAQRERWGVWGGVDMESPEALHRLRLEREAQRDTPPPTHEESAA